MLRAMLEADEVAGSVLDTENERGLSRCSS